jgi:hypothetical protein
LRRLFTTKEHELIQIPKQKAENMKTVRALLAVSVLLSLAIGCSTTQKRENTLSAAGFKMIAADTPEKKAQLNTLAVDKITPVQREGTLYYTFPDPRNNVLYVGQGPQYELYRQIGLQEQVADEQLNAAELSNDGAWAFWGPWGGRKQGEALQPTGTATGRPGKLESPKDNL